MNYLPIVIILLLVMLQKQKPGSIFENLSTDDLAPVLQLVGMDENTLSLISQILPLFTSGNIDISQLIKNALPLVFKLFNNSKNENKVFEEDKSYDKNFDDIKDFASSEILSGLNNYFY